MEGEETRSRTLQITLTAVFAPSFYALEWGLVVATAGLVATLKFRGFTDVAVWLILWGLNLTFSVAVVVFNERFRIDLTLMETLRKVTQATFAKSRLAGYLIELLVFVRLLMWDGACQLLIYFRNRLPSRLSKAAVLVGGSGLQMLVWAKLYSLGYESIGDLFKSGM